MLRGHLHSIRELVRLLDCSVEHRTSFVEGTLLRVGGIEPQAAVPDDRAGAGWTLDGAGSRGRMLSRRARGVRRRRQPDPRRRSATPLVVRGELRMEGLLQVAWQNLLELEDPIPGHPLKPVDEPDVEVGAGPLLGDRGRPRADHDMNESVRLLAGERRPAARSARVG